MIILDTDHFSALKYGADGPGARLRRRMAGSRDQFFAVTVITLEEQMRGWLAEIVRFFNAWEIVAFDDAAAAHSAVLRKSRLRTGTMDLKIASIALAQDALLLTANTQDFARVAGLRFENWLD